MHVVVTCSAAISWMVSWQSDKWQRTWPSRLSDLSNAACKMLRRRQIFHAHRLLWGITMPCQRSDYFNSNYSTKLLTCNSRSPVRINKNKCCRSRTVPYQLAPGCEIKLGLIRDDGVGPCIIFVLVWDLRWRLKSWIMSNVVIYIN